MRPTHRTVLIVGVILFGVALRVALYVTVKDLPLTGDATSYATIGRAMLDSTYTGTYWPPFAGFVVAVFSWMLGPGLAAERFAALVPALLTLPLAYWVARTTFGYRAALISTSILAIWPGHLLYSVEPRTEVLSVFWVLLFFGLLRSWVSRSSLWLLFAVGVVIGLAGLTRAPLLFLGPIGVYAVVTSFRRRLASALLPVIVMTIGALLVVLPWTHRNHTQTGGWIAVNSNGIPNLYHANRDGSDRYLSYRAIYDEKYSTPESRQFVAISDESTRHSAMQTAFWKYLREHPGDYVIRCSNRFRSIFAWDLMPLARLTSPNSDLLPVNEAAKLAFGALHAFLVLLLGACAVLFCVRAKPVLRGTMLCTIGFLSLPYVLVSATPNYGIALHTVFLLASGYVLAKPLKIWRCVVRQHRVLLTLLLWGFLIAVSVEWTVALLRAGPAQA